MTNDRIQRWLAAVTRHEANRAQINELPGPLVGEAAEIIRLIAGPDGALGIADAAAVEVIVSECPWHDDGGLCYFEVSPIQSAMALDAEDAEIARAVGRAVRYLAARDLLEPHPSNARLVRPLVENCDGIWVARKPEGM